MLCGLFGYSRQAYYKRNDEADFAQEAIIQIILSRVSEIREHNPKIGGVKLFIMLYAELGKEEAFPGRDSFLAILRQHNLLLNPPRSHKIVTTDSSHSYRKYPNLIKDRVVESPNCVWASDITYVTLLEGICYLSLITDHYSRKIVGWAVGETLETKYCLEALDMALAIFGDETPQGLIHHSDRGVQYCSYAYVEKLMSFCIQISMSKPGTPKENAIAERVNGILKNEWLKDNPPKDIDDCRKTLERIIKFYNEERPHMSIGNKTPNQAHLERGPQKRLWKNSWNRPKDSSYDPDSLCASQGHASGQTHP